MLRNWCIAFLVSLLIVGSPVFGQSLFNAPLFIQARSVAKEIHLGNVPTEKLQKEDLENKIGGAKRLRFGLDSHFHKDLLASSEAYQTARATIYTWKISSDNAASLSFLFDVSKLPHDASLLIGNEYSSKLYSIKPNDTVLPTFPLAGKEQYLHLLLPGSKSTSQEFILKRATLGYKPLPITHGFGDSGPCMQDINCPLGQDFELIKKSVVLILDGGFLCTGTLLNSNTLEKPPYILTGEHCFAGSAATWLFVFNYESPSCGGPDGSLAQSLAGASLRARYANSDALLLELIDTIPSNYDVFYAGWDRTGAIPDSTVSIHHPRGDVKKISRDAQQPLISGFNVPGSSHWQVVWDYATTTEVGSSGSPLFSPEGSVIGVLEGGFASCTNLNAADWYGRFSDGYVGGGLPFNSLGAWLDPDSLQPSKLLGFYPNDSCPELVDLPLLQTWTQGIFPPFTYRSRPDEAGQTWIKYNTIGNPAPSVGFPNFSRPQSIGAFAELQLPPFNGRLYDSLTVRFDVAYTAFDSIFNDTLLLVAKSSCLDTTAMILWKAGGANLATVPFSGAAFFPSSHEWRRIEVGLDSTQLQDSSIFLSCINQSGFGNNLFIDNLTITSPNSPPIVSLDTKDPLACLGSVVTIAANAIGSLDSASWLVDTSVILFASDSVLEILPDSNGDFLVQYQFFFQGQVDTTDLPVTIISLDTTISSPAKFDFLDTSASTFKDLSFINPDGDLHQWTYIDSVGVPPGCVFIDHWNFNRRGQQDIIQLPAIRLDSLTNPSFSFVYAYQAYNQFSSDSLAVQISMDCGLQYETLWNSGGIDLATVPNTSLLPFSPQDSSEWDTLYLSLNHYKAASEILLRIVTTNDYGNNIYVDEISIGEGPRPCKSINGLDIIKITNCPMKPLPVEYPNDLGPDDSIFVLDGNNTRFLSPSIDSLNWLGNDTTYTLLLKRLSCPNDTLKVSIPAFQAQWDVSIDTLQSEFSCETGRMSLTLNSSVHPSTITYTIFDLQSKRIPTERSLNNLRFNAPSSFILVSTPVDTSCSTKKTDTLLIQRESLFQERKVALGLKNNAVLATRGFENYDFFLDGRLIQTGTDSMVTVSQGTIVVIATDSFGCQSRDSLLISSINPANGTLEHYLKIYPNPSSSLVTIESSSENQLSSISVTTLSGRQLQRWEGASWKVELNISNLQPAVYLLAIRENNGFLHYRLVSRIK